MSKKDKKQDDWIKRNEKDLDLYMRSKGVQKMWNYFLEITKNEYFVETIKELRNKYKIPDKGFGPDPDGHYSMPPHNLILENNFNSYNNLRNDIIEKICKKYKLHYFDFSDVILQYIYYNKLYPIYELSACGLFRVEDVIEEKIEPFGELFQKSDDMAYPISIRISPYASQRDIVDFIKNKTIWKREIEYLQNKYKDKNIKIGKIKAKKQLTQKRNQFIYSNKSLPRKRIKELVSNKFKTDLDYEYIGKIISMEKKRRKEL
ncbi:MAG: hypothetical protein WC788_04490 [Candidatus Paceibacterota bacterium]|jgi:hypothetical protein